MKLLPLNAHETLKYSKLNWSLQKGKLSAANQNIEATDW